jgi:hypothetical protein
MMKIDRIKEARATPAYRLGYMEAVRDVTGSEVICFCEPYLQESMAKREARELASFLITSLQRLRRQYGIPDSRGFTTAHTRERFAHDALKSEQAMPGPIEGDIKSARDSVARAEALLARIFEKNKPKGII